MEDKIIADKELFDRLSEMMASPDENDIIVVLGIMETFDPWDRQNQKYKEQLYEILSENSHIVNKTSLKVKFWMSQF